MPDEGATSDARPSKQSHFVGHALVVGILTLLSRLTGLVRDAVLAAVFGLGPVSDAFFIGFIVPNLFRRLFGEGALTAAFIPAYTEARKRDPETARRLASLCVALLVIVLGSVTLVGEFVLNAMLSSRGWSHDTSLTLRLTMIMLPYMPMICLVALVGGVLQVHGRFGAPAAAPILLNVTMIAGAFFATAVFGPEATKEHLVRVVSFSVVLAGACQLAWQFGAMSRVESFTAPWRGFRGGGDADTSGGTWPALRSMLIMMGPMVVGLAVFQINTLFDSLIAFGLSPKNGADTLHLFGRQMAYPVEPGGVAALQWSQRLYQFPLGVFGLAIATAIFPALTHAAPAPASMDAGDAAAFDRFREILRHGLRLTFFIGLPASVGLILVRLPLSRVVYERGEFAFADSLRVARIVAGYSAAVWAYSMTHVVTRAFYALKDSRTPLNVSIAMVICNLILNLALVWPMGVAGLAWSSSLCAVGQVMLLLLAIRRYVPSPVDASVWRSWGRSAMLTACMAAAIVPILIWYEPGDTSWAAALEKLAVTVGLGVLVFVGGAWAMDAEEVRWLLRRRAA